MAVVRCRACGENVHMMRDEYFSAKEKNATALKNGAYYRFKCQNC